VFGVPPSIANGSEGGAPNFFSAAEPLIERLKKFRVSRKSNPICFEIIPEGDRFNSRWHRHRNQYSNDDRP